VISFCSHIRVVLGLFAAVILAASGLTAPAAELSEEIEHITFHAEHVPEHSSADERTDAGRVEAPGPQHPETPGHAHCGPSCHLQVPDGHLDLAAVDLPSSASFSELTRSLRPSAHLDGLFRPPRV
jgi:hypothetical protein